MNPIALKILTSLAMWGIKRAFDTLQERYDSLTIEQKEALRKKWAGRKIPEDWHSVKWPEP